MSYPEGRGARRRVSWLLASLALAGAATAQAGSNSLAVTATVISKGVCKFQTSSATLNFGTINPASTATATASTTIQVRCTGAGSNSTVTYSLAAGNGLYPLGAGLRQMRNTTTTTEFMAYSLTVPPGATIPKNTITNVTISGSVAPAAFQNAAAGGYSDTVVLTLDP
jgi:hypothetical protein